MSSHQHDQFPLPPGWQAYFDETYQRYYFVDPHGLPTWYDPRLQAGSAGALAQAGSLPRPQTPQAEYLATLMKSHAEPTPPPTETIGRPQTPDRNSTAGMMAVAPDASSIYDHVMLQRPNSQQQLQQQYYLQQQQQQQQWYMQQMQQQGFMYGYPQPTDFKALAIPAEATQHREPEPPGSVVNSAHSEPFPPEDWHEVRTPSPGLASQHEERLIQNDKRDSARMTPQPIIVEDDVEGPRMSAKDGVRKKGRRYCCCFRKRSTCATFVCLLLLAIFGGLAAAGFFLWPRWPTVKVGQPYYPVGGPGFATSGSALTASPAQPFTISITMQVDVSVYSPNYEDVTVDTISFNGNLLSDTGVALPNAKTSGASKSIVFKSMANTTFSIPISLNYAVTNSYASLAQLAAADDTVGLIAEHCGLVGGIATPFKMSYKSELSIPLISWTGYKPSVDGTTSFPCPINPNSLPGLAV